MEKLDYIKLIDSDNKYCISYIDECKLDMNILKQRQVKDIIKVKYNNYKQNNSDFTLSDTSVNTKLSNDNKLQIKNEYCLVDPSQSYEYRNQIQIYGGKKIRPLLKNINNKYNTEYNILKKNYKSICMHLIDGLYLMHSNEFVHRDIKLENMTYSKDNNKHIFKYIDFGLSNIVKKYKDLELSGTSGFIPLDIVLMYYMIYYFNKNYDLNDYKVRYKILVYIIVSNYSTRFNIIADNTPNNLYNDIKNTNNIIIVSKNGNSIFKVENYNPKIYYLEYLNFSISTLNNLYDKYLPYIINKNYDTIVFNIYDGLVYKTDIFALGIVFGTLYKYLKINDNDLHKLIMQMVHQDPNTRLNINQIKESDFYTKVNTNKPLAKPKPKPKTMSKLKTYSKVPNVPLYNTPSKSQRAKSQRAKSQRSK
jgi:serine/threonine protein kinase